MPLKNRLSRSTLFLFVFVLLVTGCSTPQAIPTAPIPQKPTLTSTVTITPTRTRTPTPAQSPTRTATGTITPIPTYPINFYGPQPIGTIGQGELGEIYYSPDGKTIIRRVDSILYFYNAQNYQIIGTFKAYDSDTIFREFPLRSYFSPDNKLVAINFSNSFGLFEVDTAKFLGRLGYGSFANEIAFTPDNQYAVISVTVWPSPGDPEFLVLLNINKDKFELVYPVHYDTVQDRETPDNDGVKNMGKPSISSDGTLVAAGGDKTVYVWELLTGKQIQKFIGHTSNITGTAFSPDGKFLASYSKDRTVRIWDINSGKIVRLINGLTSSIQYVKFSSTQSIIAIKMANQPEKNYNYQTGKFEPNNQTPQPTQTQEPFSPKMLNEGYTSGLSNVLYSPDGKTLAVGGQTITLWDPIHKTQIRRLDNISGNILEMTFSPDSRFLAGITDWGILMVWDIQNGQKVFISQVAFHPKSNLGPKLQSQGLAFSASSDTLAVGSGNEINFWSIPEGKLQQTISFEDPEDFPSHLSFSPDGLQLAAVLSRNLKVWIWNAQTLENTKKIDLPPSEQGINRQSWLQWPWLIRFNNIGGIDLWNISTEKVIPLSGIETLEIFKVSPDGQLFIGYSEEKLSFWDAKTNEIIEELKTLDNIADFVISPDNKTLAVGQLTINFSGNASVQLWDIQPILPASLNPSKVTPSTPTPTPK
jgi:WD40 repeat protein